MLLMDLMGQLHRDLFLSEAPPHEITGPATKGKGSGVIYGPTLQRIQRLKINTFSNSKLRFCIMRSFIRGFVPCNFVMIIIVF